MERVQNINPERILWCCKDRGVAPEQLASDLRISSAGLAKVLEGGDGLTFNQLQKVASFFGRGVLFFLDGSPVDELQVHSPQFRTLANQKLGISPKTKTLIERAEKQRAVYLSLLEDLDAEDELSFLPPSIDQLNPASAAQVVRGWLDLDDTNNFESYRSAVESRGVLVFRTNGYAGKWQLAKENPILGFSLYDDRCPLIVVKKLDVEVRQSFTLFHELGHLLLHRTSSIDDEVDLFSHSGQEREANEFAGHLLVPPAFLDEIDDKDRPANVSEFDSWLEDYRKAWGVSSEVILLRLIDSKRLPREHYQTYRTWRDSQNYETKDGGNRAFRHREPRHMFGDGYVKTVLDALGNRHITLTKASSYLDGLKVQDLHRLEAFYAGN
ncbi:ImmA/IrrE family metallo-endopeptidase [Gammaproteobacteria bacterium]|nr:ImmA/IrrE family metallo-endopeptidase [Gammaproteobacteria bacterium]